MGKKIVAEKNSTSRVVVEKPEETWSFGRTWRGWKNNMVLKGKGWRYDVLDSCKSGL